jgi:hypothetical protein
MSAPPRPDSLEGQRLQRAELDDGRLEFGQLLAEFAAEQILLPIVKREA